jgi:8-oxo-dGTP pyrophosphatase MutT (NUDIX family)
MTEASWIPDASSDQTLEENWLFRLRRERFLSRASGRPHDYYVIHLADAVNVVALTDRQEVILVRQFRAGSRHDSLETPGGLLDAGEDPLQAGARELLEETGYAGGMPRRLGTDWSNPSILSSRIHTVLITGCRRVAEPKLDHGEEVAVELAPAITIPHMIRAGRIDHALAVEGLLRWLVSELPGPLAQPGQFEGPASIRIATLLWIVLLCALVLGAVTNLFNTDAGKATLMIALIILAVVGLTTLGRILWELWNARDRPVLLRAARQDWLRRFLAPLRRTGR